MFAIVICCLLWAVDHKAQRLSDVVVAVAAVATVVSVAAVAAVVAVVAACIPSGEAVHPSPKSSNTQSLIP